MKQGNKSHPEGSLRLPKIILIFLTESLNVWNSTYFKLSGFLMNGFLNFKFLFLNLESICKEI